MKAKKVTVSFEYTNFRVLETMIECLKHQIMDGKEYFEDMVKDGSGAKRYLQFMQEYKSKRNYVVNNEKTVITVKSNI